ncbi:hypothetical protein Q2941_17460 [Bradyrhizobium sp. UFLA05-153]
MPKPATGVMPVDLGPLLGEMYGQSAMDAAIVETAIAVAKDFVDRPNYFTQVPDEVATHLANLWYRAGSDPRFPDRVKRAAMFRAVFGACDCAGADGEPQATQFQIARDAVLDAAMRYTKRTFDEGVESLKQAFRDRLSTLSEYLTTFSGTAVKASHAQTSSIFSTCVHVLQNDAVARAYGLPPAPEGAAWPLGGLYSGQGAQLIEAIAEKTRVAETSSFTRHQVLAAQRAAFAGAETIRATLELAADADVVPIIKTAFAWWTALQDAKPAPPEPQALKQTDTTVSGAETTIPRVSSIKPR